MTRRQLLPRRSCAWMAQPPEFSLILQLVTFRDVRRAGVDLALQPRPLSPHERTGERSGRVLAPDSRGPDGRDRVCGGAGRVARIGGNRPLPDAPSLLAETGRQS